MIDPVVSAEEPRRRLKVGERDENGRVYLGHAIVNGQLMFSSVSSIKKFDPEYDGCQRRWFYVFREGKKEERTKAQAGGTDYAKQLENYLKTGVDKMQPVLQPVKHLFPKPGPDLDVEKDLATDIGKAIELRKSIIDFKEPSTFKRVAEQIRQYAGLAAAGVPIVGAADVRHRRGVYIDNTGQVHAEDKGMRVVSIDDLKTTKRINDHVTRGGRLLEGWALTAEEVVADTQMVGYGVHAADLYPDTTHIRLAHNYAQTENGYAGVRRMGLVTVEYVRRRWEERDEPVMREMIDVAAAARAEDVPINTKACKSFGRECPHMSYCQPTRTLDDVFSFGPDNDDKGASAMSNGNGLFDSLTSTNGVAQAPAVDDFGLFGPRTPALPPIPPSVMNDEERQAQIDEAKAKLRRNPLALGLEGYNKDQNCNGLGWYQSKDGSGHIAVEVGHSCPACAKPPQVPHPGAVNPLDTPAFDPVANSTALSAEQIATIEDTEIKGRAQAIADAVQERAATEAQLAGTKEKKTHGNCSAGGTTVVLTDKEKVTRNKVCPGCTKPLKIKDKDFTYDLTSMVIPKHRIRGEVSSPSSPKMLPPVLPSLPPAIPVAIAPVLPVLPVPPSLPVEMSTMSTFSPQIGPNEQMVNDLFGPEKPVVEEAIGSFGIESLFESLTHDPPKLPVLPSVLPPVASVLPVLPVTAAVVPMNSLTLIKHIIQGVVLGLDSKESAFDRIASILVK